MCRISLHYGTKKEMAYKQEMWDEVAVNPMELARVAEPEFQYGAEAFETYQKETEKAMTKDKATKNVPVKNGKADKEKSSLELNYGLIQEGFFGKNRYI